MKPRVKFIEAYLLNYVALNSNNKVLELGCGTAQYRDIIGSNYIGLDIQQNSANSVDIIGSAASTGLESNSVDLVFCIAMLYLSGQQDEILEEVLRVLKPGGKVVIFDYNTKTQKKLHKLEGHQNYPCWSRYKLRKLIGLKGFVEVNSIPVSIKKYGVILNYLKDIYDSYRYSWICIEGKK